MNVLGMVTKVEMSVFVEDPAVEDDNDLIEDVGNENTSKLWDDEKDVNLDLGLILAIFQTEVAGELSVLRMMTKVEMSEFQSLLRKVRIINNLKSQ